MEEFNSSLILLNHTSKDAEYPGNITIPPDESNGTTGWKYTTAELIAVVSYIIIIVFGSVGNILSFIVMRRGSMKDVSTCFYMSILALADTGKANNIIFLVTLMIKKPREMFPLSPYNIPITFINTIINTDCMNRLSLLVAYIICNSRVQLSPGSFDSRLAIAGYAYGGEATALRMVTDYL